MPASDEFERAFEVERSRAFPTLPGSLCAGSRTPQEPRAALGRHNATPGKTCRTRVDPLSIKVRHPHRVARARRLLQAARASFFRGSDRPILTQAAQHPCGSLASLEPFVGRRRRCRSESRIGSLGHLARPLHRTLITMPHGQGVQFSRARSAVASSLRRSCGASLIRVCSAGFAPRLSLTRADSQAMRCRV